MKLVNISSKIINIQNIALMPDDSVEITDKEASAGSVQALVKMKYLRLDGPEKNDKMNSGIPVGSSDRTIDTPAAEQAAEDPDGNTKSEKKTGRAKAV